KQAERATGMAGLAPVNGQRDVNTRGLHVRELPPVPGGAEEAVVVRIRGMQLPIRLAARRIGQIEPVEIVGRDQRLTGAKRCESGIVRYWTEIRTGFGPIEGAGIMGWAIRLEALRGWGGH